MKGFGFRFQASTLAGVLALGNVLTLTGCGGGGGGGGTTPAGPTPTPAASPACSASNTQPQDLTYGGTATQSLTHSTEASVGRRAPNANGVRALESLHPYAPDLVEVSYNSAQLGNVTTNLANEEQNAGALGITSQMGFDRVNTIVRVMRVNASDVDGTMQRLRNLPAVQSVTRVGYRYLESATTNFPNDPYYRGTNGVTNGTTTPPFYEGVSTPGQWDMHMICAADAWGYAQSSGNTFGVVPGVLSGVPIAIIDTGIDTTHLDVSGKIIYSATFNSGTGVKTAGTNCSGAGSGMFDCDGHGTDVAGIAAANTNNSYGFAGTAYNAQLIAERVFPAGSSPTASTADIAAAITDAVNHGAKVINLSLGGGSCPDTTSEATAIANAIAAGVVVVASSGNGSASTIDAPACNPGVVAVGASAIADGNTNGTGKAGGTPTAAVEYVASYSNYSSTANWGLVAPGGDPTGSGDVDDLHWIENIYSSTALTPGACTTDFYGGAADCRILIAGTSMASPHVAGVVAMMLGAKPSLTPGAISGASGILCQTADSINDTHQGCGRLNAYRAVARALGDSTVP